MLEVCLQYSYHLSLFIILAIYFDQIITVLTPYPPLDLTHLNSDVGLEGNINRTVSVLIA